MAATIIDGPEFIYGNLGNIPSGVFGATGQNAVPDPNSDAGPSMFFQGEGLMDPRVLFQKDKVQGFTGVVPGWLNEYTIESVRTIPAAASATNIVTTTTFTSGTAVTLNAANSYPGIAVNIPVRTFGSALNGGAVVTYPIALDYGFGFATAVAASATFTPGNIWDYFVGMPLCISGAGNVGGTTALLTYIISVNTSAGTFVTANASAFSGTVAIGTGDLWGPSPSNPATGGYPTPLSAAPYIGAGPGLMLDARQALTRGIRIVAVTGSTAGNVLVSGADQYGVPMTQLLALPGGAATVWTTKNFKYIASVTPQFTDAGHAFTVGTADQFGFAIRSTLFEDMRIIWGNILDAVVANGWVGAVLTTPATNLTGDVRGSVLLGTTGTANSAAVTPFGTTVVSTGSVGGSPPVLSGVRLQISQVVSLAQAIQATQANPFYLTGVTQV